jgi:hypothetical protein
MTVVSVVLMALEFHLSFGHSSIKCVSGGSFPELNRQRHEADYSPPVSAEVSNGGALPPIFHMS